MTSGGSASIDSTPELRVKGLFRLADSFNAHSSRDHLFRVLCEIRTHRNVVPEEKFRHMLNMISNSLDVGFEYLKDDYDLLPEDTQERPETWGHSASSKPFRWGDGDDNNEGRYWEDYLAIIGGQDDPRVVKLD